MRPDTHRDSGAVVVGGQHPGLGITRSLGRRGIPVIVIDDQPAIASVSRYAKRFVKVPDLRDESTAVDAVMDIGKRLGLDRWVLFPTRDETVAAFSRHRDKLASLYSVTTPDWETIQWAWDKKKTYDLAVQLGIPCPTTYNPSSIEELAALEKSLPLAIKPAVKENFFYATGAKAWRADSLADLEQKYRNASRLLKPEQILVQEIIPGDGLRQFSYCAFFRDRQAHGVLLARRGRQHPREFGRAATYVETVEVPEIEHLAERFLTAIDYYGLVEIEFKQDPRDGQFKLLDVNARTWGFHTLGVPAGVDFAYLLYADQTGREIARSRGATGVSWLRMVTDLPTSLAHMLEGELTVGDYVRSLRRTRVESVFDVRDPLPSLAEVVLLPWIVVKSFL